MPNKPINFIIMAGKGGGADKMARLMQGIIEKENFSNRPLVPVNKSGTSGASQISHYTNDNPYLFYQNGRTQVFYIHS